eukprot:3837590-Prymnesium_polylepis.1
MSVFRIRRRRTTDRACRLRRSRRRPARRRSSRRPRRGSGALASRAGHASSIELACLLAREHS